MKGALKNRSGERGSAGHAPRAAYQISFGGLLALQVLSWFWFLKRR